MATPSNTFTTYGAIGNREDLSDIIYDISPTATPVLSAIGKGKATSTKHEWQKDALAAASGSNWVLEGDDATTDATTATTRLFNYCGISDKVPRVTGTQRNMDSAGRGDEMEYQMEKRMKELKRDVETALLQNNAYVAGGTTTARQAAGLQAYVRTNVDKASGGTLATGNGSDTYTAGTARALQESFVENALSLAWSSGAMPSLGVMNAFQKRKFANFSGNSTRQMDANEKKLVNSVDIYIDPLGSEIRIVPDQFAPTNLCYFIDPDYLKFATLRDFHSTDLAKTGDSDQKQILVEYTLEVGNEAAHAGVYDLTTS